MYAYWRWNPQNCSSYSVIDSRNRKTTAFQQPYHSKHYLWDCNFYDKKILTHKYAYKPLPVYQAIAYLNEHFLDKISLAKLASQLSFSPNFPGHLFKTQIGCSFNDYLNTLRLKYACSLLLSSNIPVKEIAYSAGYSSVEYSMYVFKKRMHMTPGEYRRQLY